MAPIAENTYDFERLRKNDAVYVDKTGMLHDLITNPGRKLYFISRPRRFGKSLMNYISAHVPASMNYDCIPNVKKENLNSCSFKNLPAVTLLYQSGCLTIKGYDKNLKSYTLGVPNEEIRESLAKLVIYSQKGEKPVELALDQIREKNYTLPYQVGRFLFTPSVSPSTPPRATSRICALSM